jgi:hypothetical protein
MMEKNNARMELSEVMKDPEMAKQIEAIISYVEKTPFSKMFPERYEGIIEHVVIQGTYKLFKEQPNMPLKNVVSTVLTSLHDDLSPDFLLKMTRLIIQKWEKASTAIHVENEVEELV